MLVIDTDNSADANKMGTGMAQCTTLASIVNVLLFIFVETCFKIVVLEA